MTEDELKQIEDRAKTPVPGPCNRGWIAILGVIKHDVPALIAEVRRLRAELAARDVDAWEEK